MENFMGNFMENFKVFGNIPIFYTFKMYPDQFKLFNL